MTLVAPAMVRIVSESVFLRPILSFSGPSTKAPNGRTAKASAKVAKDASSERLDSDCGKNTFASTTAR